MAKTKEEIRRGLESMLATKGYVPKKKPDGTTRWERDPKKAREAERERGKKKRPQ